MFLMHSEGHGLHLWRIELMHPFNHIKRSLSLNVSSCSQSGATPLHRAVSGGNIEVVNALLREIQMMEDDDKFKILSAQTTVSDRPLAWRLTLFDVVECTQ